MKEFAFCQFGSLRRIGFFLRQAGEPLADEDLREMFNDVINAGERQERMEQEIADLVRRSGGAA